MKLRLNKPKKGVYIQRVGSCKTGYCELLMGADSLGKSEDNDTVKIVQNYNWQRNGQTHNC